MKIRQDSPRKTLTKVLSSSPSSVTRASTSRSSVAAFTKRTRTVSHSRCDISSSLSLCCWKERWKRSDENFPTKISNYFNLKFCQTHGRVGHRRRWPMIADLFEINCVHGIFVAFFAPESPCRLLCDKLEMKRNKGEVSLDTKALKLGQAVEIYLIIIDTFSYS